MTIESNHDNDLGLVGLQEKMKAMKITEVTNENSDNTTTNNKTGNNSSLFSQIRNWSSSAVTPTAAAADTTKLISEELLKLNLNDRNAIYEEIHGVRTLCPDELSPELVDNLLKEMSTELCLLSPKLKSVYQQTQNLKSPSYVNERDFRLRFLRAELFNSRKAALRFANFLETALVFFGPQGLQRPIRLSDFNRQELRVLNSGRIQLMPYRDRGGRRVIVGLPSYDHDRFDHKTRAKIYFYLWFVASEDIETQRNGIIVIIIHNPAITDVSTTSSKGGYQKTPSIDTRTVPSVQWASTYANYRGSLPARMCANHLCTPDTSYYQIVQAFFALMLRSEERCRMKVHVGQHTENLYELNGYGIPVDQFPITETGKIKTTNLKKWIQLRKSVESINSNPGRTFSSIIECPRSNDVVFRPSQSVMSHVGNAIFRSLVESKHYEHNIAATREAKMDITQSVINDVRRRKGRFLVWNDTTWWTEMNNEKQIYTKIATFFRNSKVSANAKYNRQTTLSSTYAFAGGASNDKRRKVSPDGGNDGVAQNNACFGLKW